MPGMGGIFWLQGKPSWIAKDLLLAGFSYIGNNHMWHISKDIERKNNENDYSSNHNNDSVMFTLCLIVQPDVITLKMLIL